MRRTGGYSEKKCDKVLQEYKYDSCGNNVYDESQDLSTTCREGYSEHVTLSSKS